MKPLSDKIVTRLREAVELPELEGERYKILHRLARGGMGTVYLAEDALLERRVAIKVTNLTDSSEELAARMWQEATIIARLEHPGIVPIHDLGRTIDGRVFYVMRLVEGRRLDQYAAQTTSLAERLRVFLKVCETVAFAHASGVLHRDLKPENIMVGPFGEVIVMDWGIAKVLSARIKKESDNAPQMNVEQRATDQIKAEVLLNKHSINQSVSGTEYGTIVGTPAYMAPEQAEGRTDLLDERSDVYSLGAVLYFLLTERPPFIASDSSLAQHQIIAPRQLNPHLTRAMEAICLKAISSDRHARYANAQELAAEITRFLDGLPVAAYREGILERVGHWIARNRFLLLLLLAYLLMRIFVLLAFKR